MKIKVFQYIYTDSKKIEDEINEFIKDKKIIDIKISTIFEGPKQHFERSHEYFLIMYEDN